MPSDITIVIADATRIAAICSGLALTGRVIRFSPNNLASAFESIQINHPKLITVEALFAETLQGRAFVERVERLTIRGSTIRLIVRCNGSWTTTPLSAQSPATEARIAGGATGETAVLLPQVAIVAPQAGTNTRRAHRFQVLDPLKAVVEAGHATLVNISVIGAQVISGPVLRPNQTVKIALPNSDETLRLTAHVAWSTLEQAEQRTEAYYRVGMEFTDAAKQTLEKYCRQYCAQEPLPSR